MLKVSSLIQCFAYLAVLVKATSNERYASHCDTPPPHGLWHSILPSPPSRDPTTYAIDGMDTLDIDANEDPFPLHLEWVDPIMMTGSMTSSQYTSFDPTDNSIQQDKHRLSISNSTHQDTRSEGEDDEEIEDWLHYLNTSSANDDPAAKRPGFPYRGWQKDLLQEDVQRIYDRLRSTWPDDVPLETIDYHAKSASRFLKRHPEVVKGLIDNDEVVWQRFIQRMKIRSTDQRSKYSTDRWMSSHMATLAWLAQPMEYYKKEAIITRLGIHWKANRKLVNSRLNRYSGTFGAITSPDPLLSTDQEEFILAANAIHCPPERKGNLHIDASRNDLLHQGYPCSQSLLSSSMVSPSSMTESSTPFLSRKDKYLRLDSPRFIPNQDWMKKKKPGEIVKIHEAIRGHLVDKISKTTLNKIYIEMNKYLQANQGLIERIEAKEEYASWIVAKNCVKRISQMKNLHLFA